MKDADLSLKSETGQFDIKKVPHHCEAALKEEQTMSDNAALFAERFRPLCHIGQCDCHSATWYGQVDDNRLNLNSHLNVLMQL